MPRVQLTVPAVLQDGATLREFAAGSILDRPPEWCRRWIASGRAVPVDQDAPEVAADSAARPTRRGRPQPEAR